jgi:DNA polymerase epsilon subunit 1
VQAKLGFPLYESPVKRIAWLLNFQPTQVTDEERNLTLSALECFWVMQDGAMFSTVLQFSPYLYVQVERGAEANVEGYLTKKYR